MEIKDRIENAKTDLKKAEQQQTIADTQLKAAEKEKEEIVSQMATEGVTPDTIDAEIANLASKTDVELTKVEGLIPKV